ncbi:MAG: ATP-binding protein [Lachnospiraceae bacterium]|nr:ATP-binding protein [Lachnospiraceae bacterium]
MKKGNPFTLSFGKLPREYITRYENSETIISTFTDDYPVSQAYLIEGVRGSGKTVLMTSITEELSTKGDWIIVNLNSTQNLLDDLAERLVYTCKKTPDIFSKGFNVTIAGFGVGINGTERNHDSISIIEDILTELKKKHKRVLITIDEVMHDENMRHFASQFQIFIRSDYPLFLLMTGLFENIYAIQNDPALTFLLRTPKIRLEPLSLNQITKQYMTTLKVDLDEAKKLARITKGYAFAFQALGMLYYENKDTMELEEILLKLDDMLDDFVYKKIWESLSRQDKDILCAMSCENTKVSDLCQKLDMTPSVFSKYRERLLRKGVIQSAGRGFVSLALPRFDVFISMSE